MVKERVVSGGGAGGLEEGEGLERESRERRKRRKKTGFGCFKREKIMEKERVLWLA